MRRALSIPVLLFGLVWTREGFGAPTVWAVDDGEKIKRDLPATAPLAKGEGNPVWSPGQPIRLIATKNETIAFQIVVAADEAPLTTVTVDLDGLTADGAKIANAPDATDPTRYVGRPIERFVEHFFEVPRTSGGKVAGESLGWAPGSGPAAGKWTGKIPDALVPVEVAPPWSPYPMAIEPRSNGIVWIDVTIGKNEPAGIYKGTVVVKSGLVALASLPVEIDVADVTLPDRPVRTMLFYERDALERRMGKDAAVAAERHLFRLYHRHRLSPMHGATSAADVAAKLDLLDGSFYVAKNGYEGPGEGLGDGVLSLGTYGNLGDPDEKTLATVEAIADQLEQKALLATTDTFVYATDEDCQSPRGAKWKTLLAGSKRPSTKKVRVAWTCSEDASKQVVDVPIQAASFDVAQTAKARAMGKEVWAYNGHMPQTGTLLTDAPAISMRVNGWLQGVFDIGRWFVWETTFWYDGNKGGKGPYDPFVTAETFHNADGDWSMGDGVFVYPGRQTDMFTSHSIGMDGVIASIRLKNWRRGIEDAGYYQLAHAADPKAAETIAKRLLPVVNSDAKNGQPASWGEAGKPFFDARKALLLLVPKGTNGGAGLGAKPGASTSAGGASALPANERGCGCRGCSQSGSALLVVGVAWLFRRRRVTSGGSP